MAEEDEYDDFEDVSDDEKRKIARHFLLSSPPGEIKHLLKELQVIIPAEVMNAEFLSGVFEKYNETNMVAMKTDEGTLIISADTKVGNNRYYDPASKMIATVDHAAQAVTGLEAAEGAEQEGVAAPADEVLRKALEEVLSAYAKNTYAPDKGASVSTASLATGGGAHTLLISSVNTNLGAYWSGSWRSRYTVQGSQGSVKVSGRVQIKAHYFEEGNVQMKESKELSEVEIDVDGKDEQAVAVAILEAISEHESKLQLALAEVYISMDDKVLKDMRRTLPLTGQHFDWTGRMATVAKSVTK